MRLVSRRLIVSIAILATSTALLSVGALVVRRGVVREVAPPGEPATDMPPAVAQSPTPEFSPTPERPSHLLSPPQEIPTSATSPQDYIWSFPKLTLSINVDPVEGPTYVGPQARGGSGCARLMAQTKGSDITVEGMRYPRDAICTADTPLRWEPIAVNGAAMQITIRYQGETGVYELNRIEGRVRLLLAQGMDVSPPVCPAWWEVPSDILAVSVWNNDDRAAATVERVSDRISYRLHEEGGSKHDPPPGRAIVKRAGADDNGGCDGEASVLPAAWRDREGLSRSFRVYRTSSDDSTLQRIAAEESSREKDYCINVNMSRRSEYMASPKIRTEGCQY